MHGGAVLEQGLTCPLLRRQVKFLNKVAMPVVATTGAFGLKEQKTVEVPQLLCLVESVDSPVAAENDAVVVMAATTIWRFGLAVEGLLRRY